MTNCDVHYIVLQRHWIEGHMTSIVTETVVLRLAREYFAHLGTLTHISICIRVRRCQMMNYLIYNSFDVII